MEKPLPVKDLVGGYKRHLMTVSDLKRAGMEKLHTRVRLLITIFDDFDFRIDHRDYSDLQLAEILDVYVDDCALSFLELREVMRVFPSGDLWSSDNLRSLYSRAVNQSLPKGESLKPVLQKHRPTIAEFNAVSAKVAEKEQLTEQLRDEVTELRQTVATFNNHPRHGSHHKKSAKPSELDRLRAENQKLREQVASMKLRITELEEIFEKWGIESDDIGNATDLALTNAG